VRLGVRRPPSPPPLLRTHQLTRRRGWSTAPFFPHFHCRRSAIKPKPHCACY
jgi:hypothetical protein